jgi:hypothetical protein
MYVSIAEYRNLVSAERKAEDWRGANRKSQVSFSHATTSPFRETPERVRDVNQTNMTATMRFTMCRCLR